MGGGYCQSLVNDNVTVKPFFFKRYVKGIIRLVEYLAPQLLYRLFVHGDYDVEIAASDGGAAKVISGSTNKRAKKICWVHMDVVDRGSKLKEFRNARTAKQIYDKFDLIVPVSNSCKKKFIDKFGDIYPYCVKYNPIPVFDIISKANEAQIYTYNSEKINFVSVGRLEEQKGFDRLIEACRIVKEKVNKGFHIYIIGAGTKCAQLNGLIKQYGLEKDITLLGFQPNPYPYIKGADAFLLSSRDEAFPLVVGESIVIGTPVIATDCSGVSEWLEYGKYGLIMENSTEGISEGIIKVLNDLEILDMYRREIPNAQKKISFQKMLKDFETIL